MLPRLFRSRSYHHPSCKVTNHSPPRCSHALIHYLNAALKQGGTRTNGFGEKYSLYSLRHFYAVAALRNGIGVFEVARNMGTSVKIIQEYYGKQATPTVFATRLGD